MKKLISLILLMAFSVLLSFARERFDVIRLKNGSIIKGKIAEIAVDQYIKIQISDSTYITCSYNDIARTSKSGKVWKSNYKDGTFKSGPMGFFNGAILYGDQTGLKSTFAYGARFNKFFVGGGLGLTSSHENTGDDVHFAVPIFVDARFDFIKNATTPYLEARAGSEIAVEGKTGFYGSILLGCKISRFQLGLGLEQTTGRKIENTYEYGEHLEKEYSYPARNAVFIIGCEF
ncbi:MAG: hypothetical protein J5554_04235 [Paludibacteraceae bacterium]|nr:hypothetical protein [Paludibacteraceae bacterium]